MNPPAHAFVQRIVERRVREASWRAEWGAARVGHVVEAAYLRPLSTPSRIGAFWRRLFGGATVAHASFATPFDAAGGDALGLLEAGVPHVEPDDGPEAGVRQIEGAVTPLGGPGRAVLEELWVERDEPPWRVVELEDFAVVSDDGVSVVVSCGLAPLTIAPPTSRAVSTHVESLGERALRLVPDRGDGGLEGSALELRTGDRVRVLGTVRPIRQSQRAFELQGWGSGYRSAPPHPTAVLGDEDGTRLVIARLDP